MTETPATVLIVDDEKGLVDGLRFNLEHEGYRVEVAHDGNEALFKVREAAPTLVLLDVMMPHMSGLQVLEQLREGGDRTPIILLTAKSQPEDKVRGLELGADDYVTKPFGLPELLARIRAVLRRTTPITEDRESGLHEFDGLTVDLRRYVVIRDGTEHALSRFESEILRYLLAHVDQVVTRRDLLTNVWGYVNLPTTRTVDNHIARLRKKIEEHPDEPRFIHTVHGIGYRFESGTATT
ncbi:MAG: response regulator transcription factor [Planctomycetes bacterium]|nr:response regulator transcription factor [Planctomycetota bacterium]